MVRSSTGIAQALPPAGLHVAAARPLRSILRLEHGWELAPSPPGSAEPPETGWLQCAGPRPVAAALPDVSREQLAASDWWFRLGFEGPPDISDHGQAELVFRGLTTGADVWINGEPLLTCDNMFRTHVARFSSLRSGPNELLLRFSSLEAQLSVRRRGRPRWRSPMVPNQNLRWLRTSHLGHIDAWGQTPFIVGPWRPVELHVWQGPRAQVRRMSPRWADGQASLELDLVLDGAVDGLSLRVGSTTRELDPSHLDGSVRQVVDLGTVDPWWPATHGAPVLHAVSLTVERDGVPYELDLGKTGFRTLTFDPERSPELAVNGYRVFVRGASWLPDPLTVDRSPDAYRRTVESFVAAGANMLRVPANTGYECDAFFDACDSAGMLVWQDLAFARLDFPFEDEEFRQEALAEVSEQAAAAAHHPSLAVICGSSEITLQSRLFSQQLSAATRSFFECDLREALAGGPQAYIPYTPSLSRDERGVEDVAHYFGVSAYLQALDFASLAGVRFAAESLAFSNVPEDSSLAAQLPPEAIRAHHPLWKAGVPRDRLAGWDFEDVRDFYFRQLTGQDPMLLRYQDHDRYLALSRRVSGEVMAAAFRTWRASSRCGGALVWTAQDMVPGAGWGMLDVRGRRKAPFYYLSRLW
ncbi:MAG: hypothetical protein JOZ39_03250, partial [Chloroflexi bacterium]|nr:hypothetical protein [Chloroflexota bacterium]